MASSSTSLQRKHDIFISFCGRDVRDYLIPFLINWLDDEGLSYFFDEDAENAGKKIEDNIFPAIPNARVALVVLSENYAGSRWCLDELVEILNCTSEPNKLLVIPIFYRVEPIDVTDLARKKSNFGKAFKVLVKKKKYAERKPIWEEALQEVKNFMGFESIKIRNDRQLLDTIIESLYRNNICQSRSLSFVKNAIGADRLARDVICFLRIGNKDVRTIGIGGTEGIGKTMVAGAVCDGTLCAFDRSIFLEKVGDAVDYGIIGLQKRLIRAVTRSGGQDRHDDLSGNIRTIKSSVKSKKILLVLDGVTNKKQLENFGAEDPSSFYPGSRILITTGDRELLDDLKPDDRYIVEGLNRDEAFRLFCRVTFGGEEPKEGYEELSRYLAHYAGGHPLALKLWGSSLKGKPKDRWQEMCEALLKLKSRDLNMSFWSSTERRFWSKPVNSIGAEVRQNFEAYPFKAVGPYGGRRSASIWNDDGYEGLRQIDVGFDSEGVRYITVVYNKKGSVTRGTEGGETSAHSIKLDVPSEYLTSISGHTKEVGERTILQSLTFHTNKRKPETVGTSNVGRKFSSPCTGGKIIGFHGSCHGFHLESIGAFYEPVPHTPIDYSDRVVGPFGGAGEKTWDSADIKGIVIECADFINSVTFEDVGGACSIPQTTYRGGCATFKVKLDSPNEYITAFSGGFRNAYDGRILINSLTFLTNKRILGPIGGAGEEEKRFSSPEEAVKVVRFFGRTDDYLESIGAQVKSSYPFESVGLFGSSNAPKWDDGNDHSNVSEILVEVEPSDGKYIRSVQLHSSERHGGTGEHVYPINIDAREYLTSISGYYTKGGITSLSFRTNKKMIGPVGQEKGMHFSSPATGGKIVGFYGKSGDNLEAIGAHFKEIDDKCVGPFGSPGGKSWDHDNFDGVREIKITFGNGIRYLGFLYTEGDDCKDMHVGRRGSRVSEVQLDLGEYLTCISGYTREDGVIQSLTFYSNKRRLGPYGKEEGKYFWYPSAGTRITSFYGTYGKTLNSIGVYVKPTPQLYTFKSDGPFGGCGGTQWDDGVHTDVRGFHIRFGNAIQSIEIAYDDNGSFVSGTEHGNGYDNNGSFTWSLKPGEKGDDTYKEVLLDYPKERLLWITVWVDENKKPRERTICDLQIVTTETTRTYGPYIPKSSSQRDKLKEYHIPSESGHGRIVGFFGRVRGGHLHSIGARLGSY